MRPTGVTILQRPTRPRWVVAVWTALMVVPALFLAAGTASAAPTPQRKTASGPPLPRRRLLTGLRGVFPQIIS